MQSRSVINPDFNEEDLAKEPKIKLNKNLLFGLLACMLFVNVGNFFSYDFPQLFENVLISKFNVDAIQVSFLYAIYSIPNFIFAPILSIMLNHTGLGFGAIILSSMVFLGQLLVYYSCQTNSYLLMIVARGLYGIGAESLVVAQASMAERWFTGKFLSLAIGLNNVVGQLGVASAAWICPTIFVAKRDIQWVVFVMACLCFFCWIVAVGFWTFENKLIKEETE